MPSKQVITTETGIKTPLLSQAIKYGDTIYISGNVGMDFVTNKMAQGNVADRTVSEISQIFRIQNSTHHILDQ